RRGDVLLGLGVGLMIFYGHGFFEWVWRLTEVSYVYFTIIAIVAVLKRQIEDDMALGDARTGRSAPRIQAANPWHQRRVAGDSSAAAAGNREARRERQVGQARSAVRGNNACPSAPLSRADTSSTRSAIVEPGSRSTARVRSSSRGAAALVNLEAG